MVPFRLTHRHAAQECPTVYAAWKGFDSPLRGHQATSSCRWGDHQIWWDLEGTNEDEVMSYLPGYVADRAQAVRIGEVEIP
jgi:hypothetical protein